MDGWLTAGGRKLVLGMVHLSPLPGTPFHEDGSFGRTLDTAVRSARALYEGGADGCLIQTVDRVYTVDEESDPARTVAMGLITRAVAEATDERFHIGVQLMRNALTASLAVAKVAGGGYIRAGALVGQTLTAHGMVRADPLRVMEYRRRIGAEHIRIIAEIDSMHFRWFDGQKTTAEVARAARAVGADAVSLCHPDEDTALDMIASVREAAPDLPVILAGHTRHENAARLMSAADGAFVGTCLERDGWGGEIDRDRVAEYVDIVRRLER
ncbi:BtpA/SgcQ family protein [Streptomyces antimycoticus]|uniref:Phosphorybosylanthranilate isomerase n=1 Tax=Streptomyces antimycoticus TaxID=68175 RepID=A0A4D4JVS9_9ACTN|nr:BtpA/SgcQ family protein [Streptomyces antimycoticus]GDY40815.1 phosphorybosylanthranilate isomerase [Streptomyces antimycoticus]